MAWFEGFGSSRYAHRRIVVADVDDRSIRLIDAAATRAGIHVTSAVEADFPTELDLADAAAVGKFAAAVREQAGIVAGPGAVGIAAHQAGWHVLSLPAAPDAELWPMAQMQARREQHLDGMAVEYCRLPAAGEGRKVLAGSVHTELLERVRAVMAGAGCPADAVGLRPLALLRHWNAAGPHAPDTMAALVDVGRTHTEIILIAGVEVVVCRSAPVGWGGEGGDEAGAAGAPASASPDAWMEALSLEIRRTIFSYAGRAGAPTAKVLHLSAGAEHLERLAGHLRTAGGYEVIVPAPTAGVEGSPAVAAELGRGNYAAALGLARQYLIDRDVPLDFQHPKIEQAEKEAADAKRTRRLVLALAAIIALAAPLPFYVAALNETEEERTHLADLKRRTDVAKLDAEKYKIFRDRIWADKPDGTIPDNLKKAVADERKDYQWMKDQLADLKALDAFAGKSASARRYPALRALGEIYAVADKVFGSERGGDRRGLLTEFRLDPAHSPTDGKPDARADRGEKSRIRVAGKAESLDVVTEFVSGLNNQGGLVVEISFPATAGRDREAAPHPVAFELTYRAAFLAPDGGKAGRP